MYTQSADRGATHSLWEDSVVTAATRLSCPAPLEIQNQLPLCRETKTYNVAQQVSVKDEDIARSTRTSCCEAGDCHSKISVHISQSWVPLQIWNAPAGTGTSWSSGDGFLHRVSTKHLASVGLKIVIELSPKTYKLTLAGFCNTSKVV